MSFNKIQSETRSPEELCEDPKIKDIVLKDLQRIATRSSIPDNALVTEVKLLPGDRDSAWTAANNCLTASNKLNRKIIQREYDLGT